MLVMCGSPLTGCLEDFDLSAGRDTGSTPALESRSSWVARPDPVLPAGHGRERGLWNDPSVLKLGSQYVMYMTSSIDEPFEAPIVPFRAVSSDGIDWQLEPEEPLLHPRGTPFEKIETPSVVRFNGRYHMYYTGIYTPGTVPSMAIGHAVSTDGIHWEDDKQAVLTATGNVQEWNGYLVAEPGALVRDDLIYVYFTAMGARPSGRPPQLQTIGVVTSRDGVNFDEPRMVLEQSPAYPASQGYVGYSTPSAVVIDGEVHLFHDVARFVENGNPQWQQVAIQHAVSRDGITDFRQDDAPLLVRKDLHWTSGEILAPSVLVDGDRLKMWFAGHVTYPELVPFINRGLRGNEFGIGYATLDLTSLRATTD